MVYKTLEKLFYADSSSDRYARHDELLHERLTADGTVRTGIHLEHGELFACVPLDLSVASERILRKERKISNLWNSLPYVALGASIRSLVLEEVVFSNEMEGVHSTRRQIDCHGVHRRRPIRRPELSDQGNCQKEQRDRAPYHQIIILSFHSSSLYSSAVRTLGSKT